MEAKANELIAEYKSQFRYVLATYHPPGLPNEMPGKASNTRSGASLYLTKTGFTSVAVFS